MEIHPVRLTLVPLSEEEVRQYGLQDVVALYMNNNSEIINVGRPSLAPYYPIIANMFGFNRAIEKGYYLVLKENIELQDKPIYSIIVNRNQTIDAVSIVNSLPKEVEVNDLLANYIEKQNKIRK